MPSSETLRDRNCVAVGFHWNECYITWMWGGVGMEKPSRGHGSLKELAEIYNDVRISMNLDQTCAHLSLSLHLSWELLAEVGVGF